MVEKKNIHVIAEPAKQVEAMTISVEIDKGKPFFLHSRYNPIQEAKDWLATVEITPETAYVVLGFGLGYHVKEMLEVIDRKSTVLVVEPNQETSLVNIVPQCMKDTKWLSDERLRFISWSNLRDVSVDIADTLAQRQSYKVVVCPHFPSIQIYSDFYKELLDNLATEIDNQFFIKVNFGIHNTTPLFENAWCNLKYILKSPGILGFKSMYKNKPAIIVGSGPSLNRNIHLLNDCYENAMIIACGSAMRALRRNGVDHHIFASADPFPAVYESLKEYLSKDVVLLSTYDACHELVKNYPGPKMFAESQGNNYLSEVQPCLPDTDILRKSVSVTSTAIHFAIYSGCNPIIFVGQDCALSPDDTRYVAGIDQFFNDTEQYFEVQGYGGVMLKTPPDLRDMLNYIQNLIQLYPDVTFINATEGGAIIQGAPNMSLDSARQQYFNNGGLTVDGNMPVGIKKDCKELLVALGKIKEDALNLKSSIDESTAEFRQFAEDLAQNKGYRLIKPVIDPFVLYCKFKANEYGADLQPEMEAVRDKSKSLLSLLIESIEQVESELATKTQGE
jgi:hypothetical protein